MIKRLWLLYSFSSGSDYRLVMNLSIFNLSIEEAHQAGVFTQDQALKWVGSLVSMRKGRWSKKRSAEEEGREVFNTTILCHVPVVQYDYWPKCVYLAYMTREVLKCIFDHSLLSDKVGRNNGIVKIRIIMVINVLRCRVI